MDISLVLLVISNNKLRVWPDDWVQQISQQSIQKLLRHFTKNRKCQFHGVTREELRGAESQYD